MPLLESVGSSSAKSFGLSSKDRPDILINKIGLQAYYDFYNYLYTLPQASLNGLIGPIKDLSSNNRRAVSSTTDTSVMSFNISNNIPSILTGQNSTQGTFQTSPVYMGSIFNNFTYDLWALSTKTRTDQGEYTSGAYGTTGQAYLIGADLRDDGTGTQSGAGISFGTNGVAVYEHAPGYMPPLANYVATLTGWKHIVVTYTDRQPRIYINGSLVRTGLQSIKTTVYASNPTFHGSYGYHTGNVGHYAFYSRSLSDSEVLANYNATKSRYGL